jgi:hypothetical protein
VSSRRIVAGGVTALVVAACGSSGPRQDASEPSGHFPVAVEAASFPVSQTLSQHSRMTVRVRNAGHKAIPDIAITVCNITCAYPAPPGAGSIAAAFAQDIKGQNLANPSRAVWVVDRPPGVCEYSCHNGGQGGAVTSYSNTWAMGRLDPGQSRTFQWRLTAVTPGHHVVAWVVSAGLNGKARAVSVSGGPAPSGKFTVQISTKPQQSYVNNKGQIVVGNGQ